MATLAGEAYVLITPKVDTAAFAAQSKAAAASFGTGLTPAVAKEGESAGAAAAAATSKGFAKTPPDVTKPMAESGAKATSAFHGSVLSGLAPLAAGMGGIMAASGVISFFKSANEEARESQRVNALTAAALKSTGGAANVTSDYVGKYANALSQLTGIDDEVIQGGENMLLTFTNIKNGVGAGNDIFSRGTKAALDMSVAMGTDMQTASIQVGKALNDPIQGVSALRRVGVQLTDQQQEQVRSFVKSGDTMSAQKIILKELTTEFGGAAAAAATPADKAKVAWSNFKEDIGGKLLPVFDGIANGLQKALPFIQNIVEAVSVFFTALSGGEVTSQGFLGTIGKIGYFIRDTLIGTFNTVKDILTTVGEALGKALDDGGKLHFLEVAFNAVKEAIGKSIGWIADHQDVLKLFGEVVGVLVTGLVAWKVVQIGLNVVMAVFNALLNANPIGIIVLALAAVITALIYSYQHFKTFRDIVNGTWNVIKEVAMWVWNNVLKYIFEGIKFYITEWVVPAFKVLWTIVSTAFEVISNVISWAWNNILSPIFNTLKFILMEILVPAFKILWDVVSTAFNIIAGVISWVWDNIIKKVWDLILLGIEGLKREFNFLKDVIGNVWDGIKNAIEGAWNFIHDHIFSPLINFVTQDIPHAFDTAVNAIKNVWDKIQDYTKIPINFVIDKVYNHGIVALWNAIGTKVGLPPLKEMALLAGGGVLPGYAPGHDSIPAMLSPGEGVLVPEAVRSLGADRILSWNAQARRSGSIEYFAEGGIAGGSKGSPFGFISDAVSGISGLLSSGKEFVLGSLIRLAQPAIDLIKSLINQVPTNGTEIGDLIKRVPTELLDKALAFIKARDVAPAFGNIVGGSLGTGGRSVEKIIDMARASGIPFAVNSADRPGSPDYHGDGRAVDFGSSNMGGLAKYFLQYFRSLLELIHGDSGSFVKNGQIVGADYYGAATVAQHASWGGNEHVHVAMNGDAVLGTPGGASGSLADWIAAAQKYVTIEWVTGLITLILRESGGNPNAINNWDSNAAAGDPSRGLMQTIGATFERYRTTALPDNIYDPVANIVAGMNYIHSKYGSLYNVQQAHSELPPMGYDNGGDLKPGMTLVRNDTGRTETVFNNSQSDSILGALRARQGEVYVTVLLDGEPVIRRAKAVIDAERKATINTMRSGRRL